MKITYTEAKIEIINLMKSDVISTSDGDNDFDLGDLLGTNSESTATTSNDNWAEGW